MNDIASAIELQNRLCQNVGLTADLCQRFDIKVNTLTSEKGSVLFKPGDPCNQFLILVRGSIRVELTSRSGRVITLYHMKSGDLCIITTAALLNNQAYYARGVTDSDIQALVISADEFTRAMSASAHFASFIVQNYASRMSSIISLVDRLAVRDPMSGVCQFLVSNQHDGRVKVTQLELASEIGSAREVVSRKLAHLEKLGYIERRRGEVVIYNEYELKKYSS